MSGNRQDEVEKRLARFSSVEARAAGMEEDMTAVLADISQLHSQLLAAEHANTELMSRPTTEQGPKERDLLETITRLEHQLKASGSTIEVWLTRLLMRVTCVHSSIASSAGPRIAG